MNSIRLRLTFLFLAILGACSMAGGQTGPDLKMSFSDKTFFEEERISFQLDSFDREAVWLLQSSTNGKDWDDLVYLNGGRNIVGFGVGFDRKALSDEASGRMFFRAAQQSADDSVYRKFLAEKLKWREAGYDSYSYVVKSSQGMVSYEARYTVLNGEVTEMETISVFPQGFQAPAERTIDGWFDRVESAIAQGVAVLNVDWNSVNGYPESGFIDEALDLSDEEQSWTICEFIPLSPESQKFLAARELWREADIPRYSYVLQSSSGRGFYEARYTVENGETTGVEIITEPPSFITVPDEATMDDWFDEVANAFEVGAFDVDMQWDRTLGYPTSAAIDFEEFIADEERYWSIRDFVVLE